MVGGLAAIVLIGWRYNYYWTLWQNEKDPVIKNVKEYVYYLGPSTSNQRWQKFSYIFSLPKNSVYQSGTILEIVGSYTPISANGFFEEKELMISSIKEISLKPISLNKVQALIFGLAREQQERASGQLGLFLSKIISPLHAELLVRMALGNVQLSQKSDLKDMMRKSGLSHLLSVSGFHLNMVFEGLELAFEMVFGWLIIIKNIIFGCFKKNKQKNVVFDKKSLFRLKVIKFVIFGLILLWYVILVGSSASVLRAYLMMVFRLIDKFFFKIKLDVVFVLFSVMLFLLINNPFYLYNASFLLSFSATFGVITGSLIFPTTTKIYTKLLYSVGLSVLVLLFSGPILGFFFEEINFMSLFSGVLLTGLIGPMFAGLPVMWLMIELGNKYRRLGWWLVIPITKVYSLIYKVFFLGIDVLTQIELTLVWPQNRLNNVWIVVYYVILISLLWSLRPVWNIISSRERKQN